MRAGIKAAASIARSGRGLSLAEIQAETDIAPALLHSVLTTLHRRGLIYRAGASYSLAMPREDITIAQIVRALGSDGESIEEAVFSIRSGGSERGAFCQVEQFVQRLGTAIAAILDNYSLAEAISEDSIFDHGL
jgi:DNA-binding IscR family transcriptional regulator